MPPWGKLMRGSSELQTGVLGLGRGEVSTGREHTKAWWLGARSELHLLHQASHPSPGLGGSLGAPEGWMVQAPAWAPLSAWLTGPGASCRRPGVAVQAGRGEARGEAGAGGPPKTEEEWRWLLGHWAREVQTPHKQLHKEIRGL